MAEDEEDKLFPERKFPELYHPKSLTSEDFPKMKKKEFPEIKKTEFPKLYKKDNDEP